MERVRLPKNVADAIKKLKSSGWKDEQILKNSAGNDFAMEEYFCLSDFNLMILAVALVNGYEVEQTPEDKVREYYQHHYEFGNNTTNGAYGHREDRIKYETVIEVLDLLNIKIEGVNA